MDDQLLTREQMEILLLAIKAVAHSPSGIGEVTITVTKRHVRLIRSTFSLDLQDYDGVAGFLDGLD